MCKERSGNYQTWQKWSVDTHAFGTAIVWHTLINTQCSVFTVDITTLNSNLTLTLTAGQDTKISSILTGPQQMAKEIKQQVANTDKSGQQTQLRTSDSPTQGADCRAGCWYIPRESHKRTAEQDAVSYLGSPIPGPDCRAGCWYIPRLSHKGPDCQEWCCFIPRESHTRAGLPSRMLIHTQRVPQRARLERRILFHT